MRSHLARKAEDLNHKNAAPAVKAAARRSHPILQLQRQFGNHAVLQLIASNPIVASRLQPQLRVGASDDPYEREADRVADNVMRMSEPAAQRKCTECEEEEGTTARTIRRTASPTSWPARASADAPQIVSDVISESGRPLDPLVRAFMEPRFGQDFSQVQVHTGSRAAESARAVNAVAYTVGRDIVFDEGAYRPETDAGRRLIAHELTHVIQQGGADTGILADSENEFGDSGLLHADPALQTYRRSELRVQRQEQCCCCVTSVAIKNVAKIDTSARMGHSYDLEIKMARATEHGPRMGPECTLEWFEKTNVPYTGGMAPNTWTDMFQLVPGSPTFNPWNNRSTACDTNSTVTINDPPALGRSPGRTVTRKLEFDLKVKSGPGCTCADSEKSATATQVLAMVNGAADWPNSSFTTP